MPESHRHLSAFVSEKNRAIRDSRIRFSQFGHELSNPSQDRSPQTAFVGFFGEEFERTTLRVAREE
jgi:hypothetical protein